jgi:predicted O-methyltransferase YrrM
MFDRLVWQDRQARLGEFQFRIQDEDEPDFGPRDLCFRLYKEPGLLAQYAQLWRQLPQFHPDRIVEVGIWDGGSTVLWFEQFQPERLVAIDYASRGDSPYFQRYLVSGDRRARIATYWGVDQADRQTVRGIVTQEFDQPLDLVVDDASHQYDETKATFETLFPLLRPGGRYIIEDWAHRWQVTPAPVAYRGRTPLHQLVFELVALTGTTWLVNSVAIHPGFAIVERGTAEIPDPAGFRVVEPPPL